MIELVFLKILMLIKLVAAMSVLFAAGNFLGQILDIYQKYEMSLLTKQKTLWAAKVLWWLKLEGVILRFAFREWIKKKTWIRWKMMI